MKTIKERAKEVVRRADGDSLGVDVLLLKSFVQELANAPEPEPVAWAYSDNFGTHFTSDKSEFWGVPGIESFTELYTSPPANNQSEQHLEMVNPPAPSVPDGRKMVPDEPTAEMREAGHRAAWRRIPSLFDEDDAANVYRSMLAAAPAAPERDPAVTEAFFLGDENLDSAIDAAIAAKKGGA